MKTYEEFKKEVGKQLKESVIDLLNLDKDSPFILPNDIKTLPLEKDLEIVEQYDCYKEREPQIKLILKLKDCYAELSVSGFEDKDVITIDSVRLEKVKPLYKIYDYEIIEGTENVLFGK